MPFSHFQVSNKILIQHSHSTEFGSSKREKNHSTRGRAEVTHSSSSSSSAPLDTPRFFFSYVINPLKLTILCVCIVDCSRASHQLSRWYKSGAVLFLYRSYHLEEGQEAVKRKWGAVKRILFTALISDGNKNKANEWAEHFCFQCDCSLALLRHLVHFFLPPSLPPLEW